MKTAAVLAFTAGCIAGLEASELRLHGHAFTLPPGFTIELAAGPDLAPRPVSASFDDQGRLYVTDSDGSNAPPAEQVKNPGARVLRLEDTDGDGRFDRSVVFAERVMFPQGCLWHDGWVYVAGPPSLWRFKDTDGDGRADVREEWFQGGTLTGCANDLHGPYLGPEGFLYWTKGAFAEQTHTLGDGRSFRTRAAHIFRMRPDRTGLDVVMTGGMDNPVGVAFTPDGEALFTSTFIDFSQPGFRDGVAHAAWGAVFGKGNDVLDDPGVRRAGPELAQPFVQLGAAAPSGLCRYEGEGLGAEFRDNFFATAFNLRKVVRLALRPRGASYASDTTDFVASDNPDFHPTDVLPDADGSLLIVDTGGWYKLCCPSSQLAKGDVLGGLYRVRRQGAAGILPAKLTGDARRAAYARLAQPPGMADFTLPATLRRAVWQGDAKSAGWFAELLAKHAPAAAANAESAHVVRVAAEGLGRLRATNVTAALLDAVGHAGGDVVLERALVRALIEAGDPAELRAELAKATANENGGAGKTSAPRPRAALIALDQREGGDLKPAEVVTFVSATEERLRRTAEWILARHPEWGAELAGWFRARLHAADPAATPSALLHLLTRDTAGQALLAEVAAGAGFPEPARLAALGAMANAGLKEPPAGWKTTVLELLGAPASVLASPGKPSRAGLEAGAPARLAAVRAARSMNGDAAVTKALLDVVSDVGVPADLRAGALSAPPAGRAWEEAEFAFARGQLAPEQPPAARTAAAASLARAKLSAGQLATLADDLRSAGPVEFGRLLEAFDAGGDEALGAKLLAALKDSTSARALPPGQLRPFFAKFPDATRGTAEAWFATLDADATQQSARLDALLAELRALPADVRRGQAVFNSDHAACAACHRIGYLGGDLGPDLTSIGQARGERDLLEAVVYPSLSFVRSYEPVIVATKDGEEHSGVLRRDTAEELVLATGPGAEVRLARADIVGQRPGSTSVMPAGLDEQLTRQELADLLAFLKNTRWGAN